MKGLTTSAALPGSGAGCLSAQKQEIGRSLEPTPIHIYGIVRTSNVAFAWRAMLQGYPVRGVPGGWEITEKGR